MAHRSQLRHLIISSISPMNESFRYKDSLGALFELSATMTGSDSLVTTHVLVRVASHHPTSESDQPCVRLWKMLGV